MIDALDLISGPRIETPAEHALRVLNALDDQRAIRPGRIEIIRNGNGWVVQVMYPQPLRAGQRINSEAGPIVTDATLRGALANLLQALEPGE